MRFRLLLLSVSLVLVVAAAPATAAPAQPKAKTVQSLFVLNAAKGSLSHHGGKRWTLRLGRSAPLVTRFTDRPVRQADSTPLRTFIRQWKAYGFSADPPNAALVIAGAPKGRDVFVFTLRRPRISGRTVVFSATPVGATTAGLAAFAGRADGLPGLRRVGARADTARPIRFASSSLFVDGGELEGIVYQPITFSFTNVQPGQNIAISLGSQGPAIGFSTGPVGSTESGVTLSGEAGPVPITSLRLLTNALLIRTGDTGGGGSITFTLSAYLAAQSDIETFTLSSDSDPGIEVTAQVGSSMPQVVNQTSTLFAWSDF